MNVAHIATPSFVPIIFDSYKVIYMTIFTDEVIHSKVEQTSKHFLALVPSCFGQFRTLVRYKHMAIGKVLQVYTLFHN